MAKFDYIIAAHSPTLGELPLKEGSSTFKAGGYTRDYIAGERPSDGGYVEVWQGASFETTLQSSESIDIHTINALSSENITLTSSSGKTFLMANAWVSNQQELSKGEITLSFMSNTSEQI